MIKFNEHNKLILTYGEALMPTSLVTTKEEAQKYLEDYICWLEQSNGKLTRKKAEQIAKINIGYFSGYFDNETSQRVMTLFEVVHPIFGMANPTPEEAIEKGKELAKEMIRKKDRKV